MLDAQKTLDEEPEQISFHHGLLGMTGKKKDMTKKEFHGGVRSGEITNYIDTAHKSSGLQATSLLMYQPFVNPLKG